ncbi:MAG: GTPase Era [Candidatus Dactylopiibacterium carminicum]|uniref:GTPase Era n=1 Tax=Candidatus Dactylopiibacterium carminicum TaxID=857335 RepID=A0A272ESZ7_9RHOO|nr:GTPase Era [Candidatus Dactylopiibacterium carminicum]KAF7599083.1 GTPase Era [Candidatus Dactylopiibacterium carminicum]PAS93156.1 MAG: GTPase Era [Candidatus Dactylopiibacterium carminicum]PAS96872.1 MAG: GTPase Era [Candidatus Dactylopiibacterium carminicum]PAS99097.1 MAG: GTPase Era [Candidatus Dactylopiibacterium carminicum]
MSEEQAFRTGMVAIVGRPNVGKSTLLNRLVGQKVSIVSRKAQTTRHRITGVLTENRCQFIFVDTPGFQTRHRNALNATMNRTVGQVLQEVDVVMFLIGAGRYGPDDQKVLKLLPPEGRVVLVINKVDLEEDKSRLLPCMEKMAAEFPFAEIVPVSAERGSNVPELLATLGRYLPEGEPLFDEDDITDRSERFLAAEFLREKLFRLLGEELPYGMTVEIEKFEVEGNLRRIFAAIIVDKAGHKGIVIGRGGVTLKRISSEARVELERLFDGKVYLETWVKVKSGWADDERALKSLGYDG